MILSKFYASTVVKARKLRALHTEVGAGKTVCFVIGRFFGSARRMLGMARHEVERPAKANYISHFRFLDQSSLGLPLTKIKGLSKRTINWVIPDIGIGSGGHLNIFRLISNLEQAGYECVVVINRASQFATAEAAKDCINRHFLPIAAKVIIGERNMPPAWFTFATSWQTAYTVRNFLSTQHKCYFVQDFEPWFYPPGSEYVFAEQTYRFGFFGITAGSWLAQKLAADYGMQTAAMGFSYEHDRYRPLPRNTDGLVKHVFFYARPSTSRRGFELGLLVLDAVSKRVPGFRAVIAGCDTSSYAIPFSHENAGIANLEDLPSIYSRCDAALVLSFTNLSLLPLELMACGCPVVSNKGPNVEWLLNDRNASLAEPTIEALTDAIVSLLQDNAKRKKQIEEGLQFAGLSSWRKEAGKVVSAIHALDNIGIAQ